ncbi:amidohydrolase family protein [Pseudoxanthomonas sp. JBR18]|uniref:amidohydrolase family protein n=1 Tax=Pseudoxanthomonas sp. JBR18 TaxID=2969308 RepID=UPI002306AAA5|nr:amidohydrolase family protein [Pseudoxanthomonas sp. JBR18]WCE06237.1 amidohydrolase family protein [Pseudoxanthomonas sp. JBR18]
MKDLDQHPGDAPPVESQASTSLGPLDAGRRKVFAGLAGVALAGVIPAGVAQSGSTKSGTTGASGEPPASIGRIDVHAHYLPAEYRRQAAAAGHSKPDGMPGLPDWNVGRALAAMDKFGIASALLSISSPGVHFGDDAAARKLARLVNEEGAQAVHDHPKRFGLFASLPLPDIDGSLAELDYAMDVLHADGIVMESNHKGIYPGDPRLDPVFDALNRRKAVLFLHPTSPDCACCTNGGLDYPRPMMEFMFETSRAVTNLILKGTLERYPDIRLIVPHAGAMMPVLIDRIVGLSPALGLPKPLDPEHVMSLMRRMHYDLAGYPVPRLLGALLQIADPDRLHYGSDWPFTPDPVVQRCSRQLDETPLLAGELRSKVLRDNAAALFPRLA